MGLVQHETDFRQLVLQHAAGMPPQQRLIADYLLDHLKTVPFQSVPELAQHIGVSEATVVRFAQRIGYRGFSDLKMDLVELLQGRLAEPEPDILSNGHEDVAESVANLEMANIRRTVEVLDREDFTSVADAIYNAGHTYTFGMGVSAHLADLAAYTLTQVGVRATAFSTRYSSPREQVVIVQPDDVVLAFSFPPYSKPTLDLLEDAARRGAVPVAISDRLTAPAARVASWLLPVRSDNMMFTNAIAAVTVLINALATEIATRHRDRAIEAFSHINRVLTDDDDVMPPDR